MNHRRSGFDAEQNHAADKNGHRTGAGNAKKQGRDQATAFFCVVGGFWSDDATHIAIAELGAVARRLHRVAVSNPVDNRTAQTRDHADNHADGCAAQGQPLVAPPVSDPIEPSRAEFGVLGDRAVGTQKGDDFWDRENPQADDDKCQAVLKIPASKGHAHRALGRRFTNRANGHAKANGHKPFEQRAASQHTNHRKAEDCQKQKLGHAKGQNQRPRDKDKERQ